MHEGRVICGGVLLLVHHDEDYRHNHSFQSTNGAPVEDQDGENEDNIWPLASFRVS